MATLRLLTTPDNADGSHRIGSPGGYELWHFYAEDPSRRLRIAAAFYDGFNLHPVYARRYEAYRRKPTRNAPPTPSQYACLQVSVFENEKRLASSTIYFAAGSFLAEDGPVLTLGSNRAIFRGDEITLALSDPQQATSIDLIFQSALTTTTPPEKSFPPDTINIAEHQWVPARPLCGVQGRVRRGGRTIPVSGLGQHNHYYGTGPVLAVARRWIRGCVLFPRAAEMFQAADGHSIAITAGESGIQAIENPPIIAEWKKPMFGGPTYPLTMNFGDRLILRNPRIARSMGAQLQMIYDAYVEGEQTTAWVEIDCR
jgi:hypothetical protein